MISGEQFQQLAEIGLYSNINCIIHDQVLTLNQHIIQIDELSVKDIKKYNKIFVYTHFLPHFFNKFFEYLNPGTVLITHNSDDCITENFLTYLNGNTISRWYCQNKLISHPKLFSLPIGIANSQWPHGDQQLIKSIKETCKQKTNLIFKNFDKNTNKDDDTASRTHLCKVFKIDLATMRQYQSLMRRATRQIQSLRGKDDEADDNAEEPRGQFGALQQRPLSATSLLDNAEFIAAVRAGHSKDQLADMFQIKSKTANNLRNHRTLVDRLNKVPSNAVSRSLDRTCVVFRGDFQADVKARIPVKELGRRYGLSLSGISNYQMVLRRADAESGRDRDV